MDTPRQHERATKKQKELLSFIDGFVKGNGYGPSYREVMRALEYKSVSTVATHVNSLIAKGYLAKTGASARSLSVVARPTTQPAGEQWLAAQLRQKRTQHAAGDAEADRRAVAAIDEVAGLFDITL